MVRCFGCHYCIIFSNTVTSFLSSEEAFLLLPPKLLLFWCLGKTVAKCLYLIRDAFDNFSKVFFFIWGCARYFYGTFSQINCYHFSGEALSLSSSFVYVAEMNLLVPAAPAPPNLLVPAVKSSVVGNRIRCLSQQQNSLFHILLNFF